jgi:TPR repeat protein
MNSTWEGQILTWEPEQIVTTWTEWTNRATRKTRTTVNKKMKLSPAECYRDAFRLLSQADNEADIDKRITLERAAFIRLNEAKQWGFHQALIELGIYYIQGRWWVKINTTVAKQYLDDFYKIPWAIGDPNKLVYAITGVNWIMYEIEWQYWFLIRAAEDNSAGAQYQLSIIFSRGEGVYKKNEGRSLSYLKKAADNGMSKACYEYAISLINSWNIKESIPYLQSAVDDGIQGAEVTLLILQIQWIAPTTKNIAQLVWDIEWLARFGNSRKAKIALWEITKLLRDIPII